MEIKKLLTFRSANFPICFNMLLVAVVCLVYFEPQNCIFSFLFSLSRISLGLWLCVRVRTSVSMILHLHLHIFEFHFIASQCHRVFSQNIKININQNIFFFFSSVNERQCTHNQGREKKNYSWSAQVSDWNCFRIVYGVVRALRIFSKMTLCLFSSWRWRNDATSPRAFCC